MPTWHIWDDLGNPWGDAILTDYPAISSWGPGRLDIFVRGSDAHLWHRAFSNGIWHGWLDLSCSIVGAPTATSWAPNRIDTFQRGQDNLLYQRSYLNGLWSSCDPLDQTQITSSPTVTSWGPDRLDILALGLNRKVWHKWFDGSWHDWEVLGGSPCSEQPAVISRARNLLEIVVQDEEDRFWYNGWVRNKWTGWRPFISLPSVPALLSMAKNRLDFFVLNTDKSLSHIWFGGGSWSPWEGLGGPFASIPAAVSWGPDRVDLVIRGTNSHIYHRWYG